LEEETDSISASLNDPLPLSSNDSSGRSNHGVDTGLGSLALNVFGTLVSTTSLGLAFRQDARSNAQLQLATAVAVKEMVAVHGVHGTGVIINDGFWTTIEQARNVAALVATGGTVVLSAARSRAGSLVGGGQRGFRCNIRVGGLFCCFDTFSAAKYQLLWSKHSFPH
jgi:hypothetical protein